MPLAVNAFLLKFNGKHALVDAGTSSTMGPTLGKLPDNLRAIGVAPETIDYVLLTHIHPDHSNGLVDDDGRANFPNAEVIVNGEDLRFWLEREPQASDNEMRQRNMNAARRAFAPYRDRTRRSAAVRRCRGYRRTRSPDIRPAIPAGWFPRAAMRC